MLRRRVSTSFVALLLLGSLAACSSSDSGGSSASTTAAKTTTTAGPGADAAYAKEGPHPVGTTSFALADGRRVVAWYPAAASAAGQPKESFDIASLLSPALQSQIPSGQDRNCWRSLSVCSVLSRSPDTLPVGSLPASGSGMGGIVDLFHSGGGYVGVDLGSAEVGMAQ